MVEYIKIAAENRLSYWVGILNEHEQSGKSIKEYCALGNSGEKILLSVEETVQSGISGAVTKCSDFEGCSDFSRRNTEFRYIRQSTSLDFS
jgi:hypothetical protein